VPFYIKVMKNSSIHNRRIIAKDRSDDKRGIKITLHTLIRNLKANFICQFSKYGMILIYTNFMPLIRQRIKSNKVKQI